MDPQKALVHHSGQYMVAGREGLESEAGAGILHLGPRGRMGP